ncbi:DUF7504 family protein [Natronomonas amylolytica]|uniref:DUF7504 family protein n=1 Tax=Natronomonas amylolytica TaxID=3108498 RepID=UPI0030085954
MASIDEWLADATGSYVLEAPPLSGTPLFLGRAGDQRAGETLFVTATRSAGGLTPAVRSSVTTVLDCSPGEAGEAADVGSPADLTGISMPLSEFMKRADSPAIGFDSVSTLLYYTEEAAVFRFLSVLTAHLRRNDGLGLFVLTPEAHDERTVRTLAQVFDGRIELDEGGDRVRVGAPDAPDGWQPR